MRRGGRLCCGVHPQYFRVRAQPAAQVKAELLCGSGSIAGGGAAWILRLIPAAQRDHLGAGAAHPFNAAGRRYSWLGCLGFLGLGLPRIDPECGRRPAGRALTALAHEHR